MYMMVTARRALILGLILLSCHAGKAQETETGSFSLNEAVDYALENAYSMNNARSDIDIAKKKVWETTAIGLPQATVTGSYTNIFNVPMVSFGPMLNPGNLPENGFLTRQNVFDAYEQGMAIPLGVRENITIEAMVSQLIFSGEYLVGLQASRTFLDLSKRNLARTELETKEAVAKSYYLVLVTTSSLEILKESLELTRTTLTEVEAMYASGFMEETDADQLKIVVTNLENTVRSLENQSRVAENLLKFQMGLDLSREISLTDKLEDVYNEEAILKLLSLVFNLDNNVDFLLMETQEKLMHLSLKREKSKYLPTVAGFYQRTELMDKPEFNFTPPDVIGISVSLPVFTSGARNAKISQAKIELEKASTTKTQVGQGLMIDFDQSRSTLLDAYEKQLAQLENSQLSRKIHERSLAKFKEGMISSLELTQAQNQYLSAETSRFTSLLEVLSAKAHLDRLLQE